MNTVFSVSTSLKRAMVENMTGDLIIVSSGVKRIDVITKDGEKKIIPLEDWESILNFVRSREEVVNASPRLRVWGRVKSELNEIPMIITGVDPSSEPELLPGRKLEVGRWIKATNEIMMYYRHADYLSITNNAELGITVQTVDGYINYDVVKLVGIIDYKELSCYTEFALYGFVSIDYLNMLLMEKEKTVGEILVRLKDENSLKKLEEAIEKQFPGRCRFILPENSANLVNGIYNLTFFMVFFVALLLMIMVYLCSSFLVNLSIETRRQEIGIYQALGVKKWRIGMLFGGEFLLTMIVAGLIGTSLGLYVMKGISSNGIEATIIPLRLVFGRSRLFIQNDPRTFIIIIVVLILAFLGSTLNAILKLTKFAPVEIMREF